MAAEQVNWKRSALLVAEPVGAERPAGSRGSAKSRSSAVQSAVIGPLIAAHRGSLYDPIGNSLVAEFPGAVEAVQCAVDIQQELANRAVQSPDDAVEYRTAVTVGDVSIDGNRMHGDAVNVALKLLVLAQSGAVCVSADVRDSTVQTPPPLVSPISRTMIRPSPRTVATARCAPKTWARPTTAASPETTAPTHTPALHASSEVHTSPSLQGTPSGVGNS